MPTPSSNPPDAQAFPSCPDLDETTITHPRSPSAWQTSSLYPPAMDTQDGLARDGQEDAAMASRSITLSPRTPSSSDGTARDAEPDEMLASRDDIEDGPKRADTDDDMTGAETSAAGEATMRRSGQPYPRSFGDHHLEEGHVSRLPRGPSAASALSTQSSDKVFDPSPVEESDYTDFELSGASSDYSCRRVIPISPSSYLRPGSRFQGTQQSERQIYNVQVEIKHVDLRESFLCGYLRIQGLTEDHPTLTTYFEGEIIGNKYGFITQHASWGATDKIDLSHWSKFTAFRPFIKQVRKGGPSSGTGMHVRDIAQRDFIFMRWKEHFLVPDHRVRTINGASFEGFYYICFNQVKGEVSGIYFHAKSEKFQQLELKHVEDRGCFGAMEFR